MIGKQATQGRMASDATVDSACTVSTQTLDEATEASLQFCETLQSCLRALLFCGGLPHGHSKGEK